jgi:hypothetical protein
MRDARRDVLALAAADAGGFLAQSKTLPVISTPPSFQRLHLMGE